MTKAYFDLGSGIAGDMVLGALVDLGFPLKKLKESVKKIGLGGVKISAAKKRGSFCGVNLTVHETKAKRHRVSSYREIDSIVAGSRLDAKAKAIARAIFFKLAKAEAKVHGVEINKVHFHEAGSIDSIVDIVGTAAALAYFDFDEIHSSPVPFTRGKVRCAHGVLPVPAPAVLELMKGVPLEPCSVREEIVTPTGAAILSAVVDGFGECSLQKIEKVGYGFGDKVIAGLPNALRVLAGEGFSAVVIDANLDDMNPQAFDYVIEKLFEAGAVDAALVPIQMKKNRPAIKLEVISPWNKKDAVIDVILRETTSFGVRYWPVDRKVLSRELKAVVKNIGGVKFKLGYDEKGGVVKSMPEYEDAKKLAKKLKRPLVDVLTGLTARGLRGK